jgi:hypothetical protein
MLLLDLTILQMPVLHWDLSTLQTPVLLLEESATQHKGLSCNIRSLCSAPEPTEACAALGCVYTAEAFVAPGIGYTTAQRP